MKGKTFASFLKSSHKKPQKGLFKEIEPYRKGFLKVSQLHNLYYEESGNPEGIPILFLHGGPGSGTDANHRRYFDPQFYRIILFDQRGCGKSTPHAELKENTTFDLCEDIEKIKSHLNISKWVIFGGSWGSLLAICYSIMHKNSVHGLILRGIFLSSDEDLDWFYYSGAPKIFPEAYEHLVALVPPGQKILPAYHQLLNDPDKEVQLQAAKAWSSYEARALKLKFDQSFMHRIFDPHKSLAISKIETHYFIHHCFLPSKTWIFDHLKDLSDLPIKIIHGRYDMVCPVKNALILKEYCPQAEVVIVEDAGHSGSEMGILDELVKATNEFKSLFI
ncbi:MAG: prolyl aminopeptidase [Chlamydiae bacterium]|nr:prolyl aminopeptidase [Chlamydiota bacterium]